MNRTAQEIRSLTGLRGLAATVVAISHFSPVPADIYVDVFFVLSGFVISMVYLSGRDGTPPWKKYFVARFARIIPLYLATSAVAGLIVSTGWGWQPAIDFFPLRQALHESTLTTIFFRWLGADVWNGPAWSVVAEWWTYFTCFPILVFAGRYLSERVALALALACTALLALVLQFTEDYQNTEGIVAMARSFCGFTGGWAAYRMTSLAVGPPANWTVNALFASLVTVAFFGPIYAGQATYIFLPLIPILILGLARTRCMATRLLEWRPLVYLGEISYSIYLIHFLFYLLGEGFKRHLGIEQPWPLRTLVGIGLTMMIAPVSYRYFERPARDWIRQMAEGARAPRT
jgi:peptidoglycan/LPS O-acetylase OafA/YrhL